MTCVPRNTSVVEVPRSPCLQMCTTRSRSSASDGACALVLRVPGRAEERYPDMEWHGRLSPSGNYVLAVEDTKERHGAAIIDTRTGELWRVPKDVYPWIAWSYGDIAMVDTPRMSCSPVTPPAAHASACPPSARS